MQGEQFESTARALRAGTPVAELPIPDQEKLLLRFVETLTVHAWRITDETVQGLRDAGWSEAQIAEAVYIGSFFNMMVRIADAFGVTPPEHTDAEGRPAVL